MSYKNPEWKYRPHSESVKPGYLKRRFDEIRAHCQEDVIRTAEIWSMLKPVIEGQPAQNGI